MIPEASPATTPAHDWWGRRRLIYNAVLVAAGMASLTFHAAVLELTNCAIDELSITPLTLVYRSLGYVAAMGLANLCYSLLPVVEDRVHPLRPRQFRSRVFAVLCAISFLLPFLPPLLFAARCR